MSRVRCENDQGDFQGSFIKAAVSSVLLSHGSFSWRKLLGHQTPKRPKKRSKLGKGKTKVCYQHPERHLVSCVSEPS